RRSDERLRAIEIEPRFLSRCLDLGHLCTGADQTCASLRQLTACLIDLDVVVLGAKARQHLSSRNRISLLYVARPPIDTFQSQQGFQITANAERQLDLRRRYDRRGVACAYWCIRRLDGFRFYGCRRLFSGTLLPGAARYRSTGNRQSSN